MSDFSDPRHLFGDQQLTMPDFLPLQSSMMPTVSAPSKTPEQASDLPTVPTGSLRDALLGKFDDPEIPSGLPSQEQQDQAFTHRLIGSGVGQAVDSLQNAANIFKPGAGNPHMGEASRQFGEMLAQRALGNAKERRDEALQNFQLKDATDQRHEKMFQMATALKQQRDMNDPNSDMSRQAQAQEAARLDTLIAAAQDPAMQQNLAKRKMSLAGASAAQLVAGAKEDPTEKLLGMASTERAAGAKNAMEGKRQDAQTAQGWATIGETKREHDLVDKRDRDLANEKAAGKKQELGIKMIGQQPKTVEEIGKLANALEGYEKTSELLKNRDVPTGFLNKEVQSFKEYAPFMAQDPDYIDLWQQLQANKQNVRLGMEKTVRNNKFMNDQLSALFPEQSDNLGTIKNKIAAHLKPDSAIRNTLRSKIAELRTDPKTGEMIDKSALAEALAPRVNMDAAALEKYIEDKPVKTAGSPGQIKNLKSGGKAQQQSDGSWKRIE